MLLPLLVCAVVVAAPPPAVDAPAPQPAPPAAAAPAQTAPATPAPSIDSLLQAPHGAQSPDSDEEAGAGQPQSPVPYSELDGKAYDSALKNAAAAARAAAGPLDGGWILITADGQRLYRFQFVERSYGFSQAEGAWRDLDAGPRLQGSGFIDQVNFATDHLVLRFFEAGSADAVLITVKPSAAGTWSGQLLRNGSFTQVVLKRD